MKLAARFSLTFVLLAFCLAGAAETTMPTAAEAAEDARKQFQQLEKMTDRLEILFWRGLFSAPESRPHQELLTLVRDLHAQSQQLQLRRSPGATTQFGNLTVSCNKLKQITVDFRRPQGRNYSFNAGERTTVAACRQQKRRHTGNGRRDDKSDVTAEEYRSFLDEVQAGSMERFRRKFKQGSRTSGRGRSTKGNALTRSETHILETLAENYYSSLCDLRMCLFLMRRHDPLLRPPSNVPSSPQD